MEKSEIIRRLEKIARHAVHVVGEKPFVMSLDDGIAVYDAIALLKEQEAVKPTWSRGKPFCGACGLRIHGGKFCSECGKPISWKEQ